MGPPGPLRSDGCPDMRYSCNRSWVSSSGSSVPLSTGGFYSSTSRSSIGGSSASSSYSSSSSAPRQSSLQLRAVAENAPARLKADGLPDMRYAANKSYVAERNMEIPLTTTSRRNSTAASASKTTSQTSTSERQYVPSSYSATSSTITSYSNIYASPIYMPVPVSLPSQINQPEPVMERLDSQERVSQLEDRLRMLELQKKIQELEISLQEAKSKQAVLPSGIKSQQVVIDKSISAAISTGARSRTSVPAKNSSTSSSISSKILDEINLLQVRLSDSREKVIVVSGGAMPPCLATSGLESSFTSVDIGGPNHPAARSIGDNDSSRNSDVSHQTTGCFDLKSGLICVSRAITGSVDPTREKCDHHRVDMSESPLELHPVKSGRPSGVHGSKKRMSACSMIGIFFICLAVVGLVAIGIAMYIEFVSKPLWIAKSKLPVLNETTICDYLLDSCDNSTSLATTAAELTAGNQKNFTLESGRVEATFSSNFTSQISSKLPAKAA